MATLPGHGLGIGLSIAFALLATSSVLAQTPGFRFVGLAPGTTGGEAVALSADGRIAAGTTGGQPPLHLRSFVWSEGTGRYDFGFEPDVPSLTTAYGISGDGTTVVGLAGVDGGRAYRWRGPGTFETLGSLPGYVRSTAKGVSGDGSVVIGIADTQNTSNRQAFRWTQATGMQGLGFARPFQISSDATGISRDGGTIVGWSMDSGGFADAFRWTQAGGMQILPALPGAQLGTAVAFGVNDSGRYAVGYSELPTGLRIAVLWDNIAPLALATPSGFRSLATDVSDDAFVIVGSLDNGMTTTPAIWTSATGMIPAIDYFNSFGVSIPTGFSLLSVQAVSGDGRTFCGTVNQGNLPAQGFVLTVPAPSAIGLMLVAVPWCHRRRRRVAALARSGRASERAGDLGRL